MNRTEAAYGAALELRKRAGELLRYEFEAVKLRLADRTFYTPDFYVVTSDGLIELHEVKGHWLPEGRVKIKVAAAQFPEFRFVAVQRVAKKRGGGWLMEEF